MRGLLRCCCFSPPRTSEDFEDFNHSQLAAPLNPLTCQAFSNATPHRKSWWCRYKHQQGSPHRDRLLGQDGNTSDRQPKLPEARALQNKQVAAAKVYIAETSSHCIKAGHADEKEPLIIQASSTVSEPIAPPANLADVGEGYERAPFCDDMRWRKDRSARKLSAGGTATVYRGEVMHSINQGSPHQSESPDTWPPAVTHVAVKALNVEQGDNAQLAEHEGRVLASLSDKDYVPGFHGYYTDPHTQRWHRRAYILTELVEGMNLDDLCYKVRKAASRMQPLQLNQLRRWMWSFTMRVVLCIAKALVDVHQERSHRDLKAGNVMVSGWGQGEDIRIHLIDWANSRMHTEEHRLNEYCTPEYSSPQLIAAITNLPAPVMDDAANDVWGLAVVMFQMLVTTAPGPQVPFEPNYEQLGGLVGADRLRGIQSSVQQQQADWAKHNPAYSAQRAGRPDASDEASEKQPWQLAAMQTAADFSGDGVDAAERCQHVTSLLSGMLHPDVTHRLTARQLASQQWLLEGGSSELVECPLKL